MKYQDSRYYSPKEIKDLLGVDSKNLFYWGRTWGFIRPEKRGSGRGSKNLYSLISLIKISLIQELLSYGMSSQAIESIFRFLDERRFEASDGQRSAPSDARERLKRKHNVWTNLQENPAHFKEEGALIFIDNVTKHRGKESEGILLTYSEAAWQLNEDFLDPEGAGPEIHYKSTLIINLGEIIRFIEDKTGEKL